MQYETTRGFVLIRLTEPRFSGQVVVAAAAAASAATAAATAGPESGTRFTVGSI